MKTISIVALLALLPCVSASADDRLKLSEYVQSVKVGGDLRLRYDHYWKRGAGTNDRSRLRFRLRLSADIQLPEDLLARLRLASGTGEQTSANQTFGRLGSGKDLWIDQIYLRWTPKIQGFHSVYLNGGRMAHPFWKVYSSELIWDEELNPDGLAEGLEWRSLEGYALFANALQMVTDEDSNSGKNQWLFSQQAGVEAPLGAAWKVRTSAAYHKWSDEQRSSLSPTSALDGNRRTVNNTTGVLLNRFGVGEWTTEVSGKVRGLPLSLQATLARNFRARGDMETTAACTAGLACPVARDGYQFGFILGKAQKAKTWEFGWFKRYAQTDVTVADASDGDFGDAGTNAQGYQTWAAYAPRDWLQLKTRWTVTEVIDRTVAPGDKAVNRLQLDMSVKF